eukprot:scaffold37538_cov33-Attheya_sp.AAC.1
MWSPGAGTQMLYNVQNLKFTRVTERVSEPLLHNTADSNRTPDHRPHAIESNWQIIARGISVV